MTASQQNEGSLQASKGVTCYLVSGHFTSANSKMVLVPKSTTLASGDPSRIATSCEITRPHLSTLTGVFWVGMTFLYSFNVIGSCFSPCSTYLENGFGLMRSAAKFSRMLLPLTNKVKFWSCKLIFTLFFPVLGVACCYHFHQLQVSEEILSKYCPSCQEAQMCPL